MPTGHNSASNPFRTFKQRDISRAPDPDDEPAPDLSRVEWAAKAHSDGDFEMDDSHGRVLRVYFTIERDGGKTVQPEIDVIAFDVADGEPVDLEDDEEDLDTAVRLALCRWYTRYDD